MSVEDWKEKIDQLRDLTKEITPPNYGTDLNLLKWVAGWKGDMKKIIPLYTQHMEIRRLLQFDDPNFREKLFNNEIFKFFHDYFAFPELDHSYVDLNGNPAMFYSKFSQIDFANVASHYKCSDYQWLYLVLGELNNQFIREHEGLNGGRPTGITVVQDMHGLHLTKFFMDFSKIGGREAMQLIQDNFPEQSSLSIMVNVPGAMGLLWNTVKGMLSEATQLKFQILTGHNWQAQLQKYLSPEIIPTKYGGTFTGMVDDSPVEIPADFELYPDFQRPKPDQLVVAHIRPHHELMFLPNKSNSSSMSAIKWYFTTNSPIQFAVQSRKLGVGQDDWENVIPCLTLVTNLYPEFGEFLCDSDDTPKEYRIKFRNDSTLLFSCKVDYFAVTKNSQGQETDMVKAEN